ncbi:hypothetical protein V5799_031568 [Amblyomma americanum]|uniref:omega-amidase n=1 Tax=Amblyomma americanum TaxID=6943 RepID=A0AAQ4DTM2_AMBAM
MASKRFRLAIVQLAVRVSKSENLARARDHVSNAAARGAKIVCLPEFFGFPCGIKNFHKYAEPIPGETSECLSNVARDNNVYLVGGTMSERVDDKLYHTCLVYGPDGKMLAKHRKLHLFDVDIPGKMTVRESEWFTAGDGLTAFETPYCKVGLGICYDIRFPEMASLYSQQGCQLLCYPAAFSMATGPLHWELTQRSRALDNQVYVASASPATNKLAWYVAWGHSMLVDPMGNVVASAGAEEDVVFGDVDLDLLESMRNQLPTTRHKRSDLYDVVSINSANCGHHAE